MKKVLIVMLVLIEAIMGCRKTHTIEEFKILHPDAPNRVVKPIENFGNFDDIYFSQQPIGDFVVDVRYTTKEDAHYMATGIFKWTGKQIYFESGQ